MRNYKAVVIDDEYFIRTGFKFLLDWEKLRMEIAGQASDGEQGLELVKELCPDVVFLDIKMPKMDGLTMLKKLREEQNETLVIIMSGYAEFSYAQKAIDYGVYKYLTKPINTDELEQIITKIVSRLDEQQPEVEYSGIPDAVRELIETVEKNLSSDIKLNTIADQLHMDAIYLGRLFKKSMGIGFKDYVVQKRMERAQQLIRTTNLPISEIAEKVGYREENHFRMSFKRFCGCSPREYKRQIDK